MMGQKHTQICIAKVKLHQIIEVGITSTFAPPEWSELTEHRGKQLLTKTWNFAIWLFRLLSRGAKSFSQGNYAIGGVWHWFHPFLYRKPLYNQFPSFLTFCCFLRVKNSIHYLSERSSKHLTFSISQKTPKVFLDALTSLDLRLSVLDSG